MFLIAARRPATRVSQSLLFVGGRQRAGWNLQAIAAQTKVYMPAACCKHAASLSVNNNIPQPGQLPEIHCRTDIKETYKEGTSRHGTRHRHPAQRT